MKTGLAEIFGTELVKGKSYTFYFGAKIVVFSWQGCTLELCGKKVICNITNNKNEMLMVRNILIFIIIYHYFNV